MEPLHLVVLLHGLGRDWERGGGSCAGFSRFWETCFYLVFFRPNKLELAMQFQICQFTGV